MAYTQFVCSHHQNTSVYSLSAQTASSNTVVNDVQYANALSTQYRFVYRLVVKLTSTPLRISVANGNQLFLGLYGVYKL